MDSYLEYTAVVFGVIYVVLASRNIIWCWPAGIISSALYIYINLYHALYQDAILQSYYVFAGFYGWRVWNQEDQSDIHSYSGVQSGQLMLAGAILVPVFGFAFSKFGNSLSYLDATVTVFSFIATWLTAKKILQSWLFWIAIDVVAAVMYFIKGLQATSGLYVFYAVVAVYGFVEWRRQMKRS